MARTIKTIFSPSLLISDMRTKAVAERFKDPSEEERFDMLSLNQGLIQMNEYGLENIVVVVNGLSMQVDMVDNLRINLTGVYPSITLRLVPNRTEFMNFGMPKDGDVVAVYYRSSMDEFKPIRMDFEIVSCYEENHGSWIIHGVIHLPALFRDFSYSMEDTSMKTLMDISRILGLGFATNSIKTADKQKWVSANQPMETFIQDIATHSWLNERSFFDLHIDHNYILNYINVRDQLDSEKQRPIYPGKYKLRDFIKTNQYTIFDYEESIFEYEYPVVLNNWKTNIFPEGHIQGIRVLNQSSRVSLEEGYRKFLHMYDATLDQKVELMNQLVVSKGATEDNIVMMGGAGDTDWKKNSRHLWKGINYSLPDHNTHPYYYVAEYHNDQNLKEIDKFTIEITLNGINFNLHRYMIVPVIYYEYGEIARKLRELGEKYNVISMDERIGEDTPYIVNNFLSGFYIIKGFNIDYMGPREGNPPYIRHKVILTRTEWPKSIIVTDNQNQIVSNINK